MYKICCRCKENKELSEFSKNKSTKDGFQKECKFCVKNRNDSNKQEILLQQKTYRKSTKVRKSNYLKEYYKTNKDHFLARNARRRASKLCATPTWLTKEELQEIEELYEIARAFRLYTGEDYHVDHIVPLQGKDVCGLHVPWNLQVLSATENLSKSNKFAT